MQTLVAALILTHLTELIAFLGASFFATMWET